MATEQQPHDDDRRSDLAVMDANEYKQKRRLERILDAMDRVLDASDDAWSMYVQGDISRDALNITVQRAVKNAIRECYKLLLDHAGDGDRYWEGSEDDPLGRVEVPDEENIVVCGLSDFLESETFYSAVVSETVPQRNKPPKNVTKTLEYTLPQRISYSAFMRLKEFLDDVHDMEISFEELDDRKPYDDWREQYEDGTYQGPEIDGRAAPDV